MCKAYCPYYGQAHCIPCFIKYNYGYLIQLPLNGNLTAGSSNQVSKALSLVETTWVVEQWSIVQSPEFKSLFLPNHQCFFFIEKGILKLSLFMGLTEKTLRLGDGLGDDKWHTVKFERRGMIMSLGIDHHRPVIGELLPNF